MNASSNNPDPEQPWIDVDWIRFGNTPTANLTDALKKPKVFAVYGGTGEGKSSLVENLSNNYPIIIDAFGSRDNESLAWCRSKRKDEILFLKGDSVEIDSQWPAISVKDLKLEDISKYKAIISCSAFYGNIREEWINLAKLIDKFWHRTSWTIPWCLVVREAANLLYSRISLGESQSEAKNTMIYSVRELRHHGVAMALDSVRWNDIDIDIRSIAHYTFLKAQGIEGLPDNLSFLYSWFDPYGVMLMDIEKFIIMSRKGPLGYGTSSCPYWHKTESENMLNLFNIKIDYEEMPDLGDKGASHVGDYEHVRIVHERFESHEGMEKLAEKLSRSSRTIHKHITYHNQAILSLGECDKCTRAKSLLAKQPLS